MKIEFDDNYFMSKAIDEAKIAVAKKTTPKEAATKKKVAKK